MTNNMKKIAFLSSSLLAITAMAKAGDLDANVGFSVANALSLEAVNGISFGVIEIEASTLAGEAATVVVGLDGNTTVADGDSGVAEVTKHADGQTGLLRITNGQANANINISAGNTTLTSTGGEDFKSLTVNTFTFAPVGVTTSATTHALGADGALDLQIGATLSSITTAATNATASSTALTYADATYDGDFTITVNY